MRILITGATGTIGRPLAAELDVRGHQVFRSDLQHHANGTYRRCDVRDYREVLDTVAWAKPDVVYHLAAEFGRLNGEDYYEHVWTTNVIGTRNILEVQCRRGHHPFRLIFASSSEIYGDADADYLQESYPDEFPVHQTNDYAISKWVNEQQCLNFAARHGNEIMRLRFFNAYGPGEHYHPYRSVVCLFCHAALHGQPITVYKGYHRVFMYVDDFIPTLANACTRFQPGHVVNIGGDEFRSVEELADLIWRETGADRALISYADRDAHNVRDKRPDISRAREWLGHDPHVTLEQGVPATLDWMLDAHA
jgi:dTDP-glucose 4,6-dehydratase